MSELVAAIDVGTNTVLLLVARRSAGGGLEVVRECCESPRLGAGLARTGRLDDAALERTVDAVARSVADARGLGVAPARLRLVGTAALRRAADAERFLAAVRGRCGAEVEVLPEEEEARLGHAAVAAEGGDVEALVVVDVGGGSTELVAEGGALRLSAPVGAVVLTETYLGTGSEPPSEPGGWPALLRAAAAAMQRFPVELAPRDLVALGGTAVNLAALHLGLALFDAPRTEGARLPAAAARAQAERLAGMTLEARRALPIEPERAEILPAGLACLAAAFERLGARSVRVSGRGLRYGVARELLAAATPSA